MISSLTRQVLGLLLLLVALFSPCSGQTPQHEGKLTDEDLESMSDTELELICVERGFELIDDGSEGTLSHADYVEAARRCLAIEEDMNEILESNPELAEELLAEIDRMREERELLEEERQKLEAKAGILENEVLESASRNTNSSQVPRMWGGTSSSAAASSTQSQQQQSTVTDDTSATSGNMASSSGDGSTNAAGSSVEGSSEEPSTSGDNDMQKDEDDVSDTESPSSSSTTKVDDEASSDFSLKGFVEEVIAEFEKDARLITSLILPVVKPIFSAGNIAWRYIKVMFNGAKEQLKKFQASKTANEEDSDGGGQQ